MNVAAGLGASWPGAVAVSGGGDSLALLLLMLEWTRAHGHADPVCLTVDHGLRPDSAKEAAAVAALAGARGIGAHILAWPGRKPKADIESAARDARYRLMGGWCRENRVSCLYVAHTMEDQAETFLMRLARGSGVDGLSAMAKVSAVPVPGCEDVRVVRPLLDVSRHRLRAWLSAHGQTWLEDEMNSDPRFARARLRAEWPTLETVGLTASRVAGAARHLARAREALDLNADVLLEKVSYRSGRSILLDAAVLSAAPDEIGLRVLAQALVLVSGQEHRPRFERLERLFAAIRADTIGRGCTLHGCCIQPAGRRERQFGTRTLRISAESRRPRANHPE